MSSSALNIGAVQFLLLYFHWFQNWLSYRYAMFLINFGKIIMKMKREWSIWLLLNLYFCWIFIIIYEERILGWKMVWSSILCVFTYAPVYLQNISSLFFEYNIYWFQYKKLCIQKHVIQWDIFCEKFQKYLKILKVS